MGMFDALVKVVEAAADTALLPVDVAADIASAGDKDGVERRVAKILKELDDAYEETHDGD